MCPDFPSPNGRITKISDKLDVNLSTRASEESLTRVQTEVSTGDWRLKTRNDEKLANLDVQLSSRASESTLTSINARISEVRDKVDCLSKTSTIFIDNDLNQPVTVQIKANRVMALAKSVNVGSSFSVDANSTDARTLSPDTSGWLPYLTVSLQCSVAPTSGSVTIYRIRGRGDEVKVVDVLEIRDTNIHDSSTDPAKIFIVEW